MLYIRKPTFKPLRIFSHSILNNHISGWSFNGILEKWPIIIRPLLIALIDFCPSSHIKLIS